MIYDTLNNLPNYLGMSENLDAVIEFIMARDINTLAASNSASSVKKYIGDGSNYTVKYSY